MAHRLFAAVFAVIASLLYSLGEKVHDAVFGYMVNNGMVLGATNTLLTISMITNEALMVLANETVFASQVNRLYDSHFAVAGAKIGDVVNVRRPGRFIGTTGPALNVEDYNQTSLALQLSTQFHVDVQFTTKDLTLSLGDFSDNVIQPAVAAIGNKIDSDLCVMAKNSTGNIVGVAGTRPSGLLTYLNAGAYLDAEAAPRDGRRAAVIEPFTSAVIVDSLKGLFVPEATISQQFKKGLMGRDSGGMNWKMDQNIVAHTFGSWATTAGTLTYNTATLSGAISSGWAQTSTITLTNSQTLTLNQGDTFTIANVFAANPQNRRAYGGNILRNFVVQSTVTGAAGTISVTVAPAIITGGQFQNVVVGTTSTTATVTPFSIAATTATAVVSPQNLVFHRDAYALVMADLMMPMGVHYAGRKADPKTGFSIRVVTQYTINNDAMPTRFDVLYGVGPLYQELGCRVAA